MDVKARDNFRTNLATIIEAKSLRKIHVATAAKITRAHLDCLLKGQNDPGLETSERLANAVGHSLSALLEAPEIFSAGLLTSV